MKNKVLFILATHGDEGFSIDVFKNIEKKFPKKEYGYDWIIGNPQALEKGVRFCEKDLNRSAPGNINSPVYEEKRAAEIIEMSKNFDFVVDVHGTIADPGLVKIITYPTLVNLILAAAISIKRNVIWYSKLSVENGPLTRFCHCPAIEIECGPKNDPLIERQLEEVIEKLLDQKNNLDLTSISLNIKGQEFFMVYGKETKALGKLADFQEIVLDEEVFYPFLNGNQYKDISCYKMKKIQFSELFLYNHT